MLLKEIEQLYENYGNEIEKIPFDSLRINQIKVIKKIKTIAFMFHSFGKGGVQRVISLLIPIFQKMGYKVVLITEEEPLETDYALPFDVKRYVIPKEKLIESNSIKYIKRAEELENIIRTEAIDVICHNNAMSSLLFYDMLVTKGLGTFFVLIKHQVFSSELFRGRNYYTLYKSIFPFMDRVVVLSQLEETYWRRLGINVKYIPNPANSEITKLADKSEYILWEGRLDKTPKNYLDAVSIMRTVVKQFPDIQLKIYGSGSRLDQQELEREIRKYNLEENIEYCGYCTEIDQIFEGAIIHLVTSDYEAFPMGIFEGKLYGVPLVTYNMPYLELLKNKKGYISVLPGDTEAAANAIIEILSNPILREQMQKDAVKSVSAFTNDVVIKKWEQLLNELTEEAENDTFCDDEFRLILDTIFQHVNRSRACKEAMIGDLYDVTWRRGWLYELKYRLLKEKKRLALFPYGKIGKQIHQFLNENDIQVDYIVDNFSKENGVISVEKFNAIDKNDVLVLVCSSNREIYYDIRNEIEQVVAKECIMDIYPKVLLASNVTTDMANRNIEF